MTGRSAIIFDFDGTLTKPCLDFDAIRAEIGIDEGPILEALDRMDGTARRRAEEVLLRHEWEAARHAELQEGVQEVVITCRAQGLPVAILTRNARPTLEYVLDHYGLVVDATRTREDGAIKPSPEPVLSICRELGSNPQDSWMIGDHRFDILCGRAAGTHTVCLLGDRPTYEYSHEADHTISRLTELLPLVGAA